MEIPKYVEKLLERRRKLAEDLLDVCNKVDTYCEKIGVDIGDENNVLYSDVKIYCEPYTAYLNTKSAIKKALKENKNKWLL